MSEARRTPKVNAVIGETGYGTYAIAWPGGHVPVRGMYTGPFGTKEEAIERARTIAEHYGVEDLRIVFTYNVNAYIEGYLEVTGQEKPNMAQHTPGPWTVAENHENHLPLIITDDHVGLMLAEMCRITTGTEPDPAMLANARLMAAAPKLLEALREIQNVALTPISPDRDVSVVLQQHLNECLYIARKEIARATEGKAS